MDTERRTGAVAVSWRGRQIHLSAVALLFVLASLAGVRASANNDPVERTFTEPRPEVERAVSAAKATSSGKLPALEGFVGQTQRPVERYEKAYYQCIFQIIPSVSGEILVRVTAKITAWYDDPDKQRSGYEVLPSNGRLENDALDRVEEILVGPDAARNADKQAPKKYNLSLGPIIPRGSGTVSVKEPRPAPIKTISSPVNEEEIQELRKKRVAAEKRVQQLNNALHNLQELYESQTRPANLVAIKKAGTLVYARPQEAGKPLFAAAAQDQFEMIEMKGEWIHVKISSESRGWLRKSQVEFPDDSGAIRESATDTVAKSAALFRIAREEFASFPED